MDHYTTVKIDGNNSNSDLLKRFIQAFRFN
jgi:hypothetical protein